MLPPYSAPIYGDALDPHCILKALAIFFIDVEFDLILNVKRVPLGNFYTEAFKNSNHTSNLYPEEKITFKFFLRWLIYETVKIYLSNTI